MAHRLLGSEMLSSIIDGSSIPSFVINFKHKVIYWNTAIEALSGISREKIIGTDDVSETEIAQERVCAKDQTREGE